MESEMNEQKPNEETTNAEWANVVASLKKRLDAMATQMESGKAETGALDEDKYAELWVEYKAKMKAARDLASTIGMTKNKKQRGIDGPVTGFGLYMYATSSDCPCERCAANRVPLNRGDVVQVMGGEEKGLIGTVVETYTDGTVDINIASTALLEQPPGVGEHDVTMRDASEVKHAAAYQFSALGIHAAHVYRIGTAALIHQAMVGKSNRAMMDDIAGKAMRGETIPDLDWVDPNDEPDQPPSEPATS